MDFLLIAFLGLFVLGGSAFILVESAYRIGRLYAWLSYRWHSYRLGLRRADFQSASMRRYAQATGEPRLGSLRFTRKRLEQFSKGTGEE